MHIKFTANEVTYTEALGGDIIQVGFDEDTDRSSIEIKKFYLLISVNHEFGSHSPSIEWFDGNECDGGANISKYEFDRNSLQISFNNNLSFDIDFTTDEKTFSNIRSFFSNMDVESKNV